MRRLYGRFTVWLYSRPLWRYMLIMYVISLAATYAIFGTGDWLINQLPHWSPAEGESTQFYFAFAAWIAVVSLIGRRISRRRLGLIPPRQRSGER